MSNHIGDSNKMVSDTPRTDEGQFGTGRVSVSFARQLERELNAAEKRIRLLIAERDTAQMYADQKWKLRREFHDLFGTDDIEQGVAVVREIQQLAAIRLAYIKQLETERDATNQRIQRMEDSYAAKDAQLSNLLHICRDNDIEVSSYDLIHGKEAKL